MRCRALLASTLIILISCNKTGGSDPGPAPVAPAGSAARTGSNGAGFSADLAKEMDSAGAPKTGSGKIASAATGAAAQGGASNPASSAPASAPAPASGTTPATTTPAAPVPAVPSVAGTPASATTPGGAASTPVATPATTPTGAASTSAAATPATTPTGAASTSAAATPAPVPANARATKPGAADRAATAPPVPRGPVKVPGDLAAIKLSLLPNWDRDIDEPGTFQYVVRIKGTQNTKTFSFHYGYDDPKAPMDRDQYKKYLQDTHVLTDVKDRQRGAAWFLEGNDASGAPAFRYVVLYGGKRLICYGSMYRDADSSRLGDDRDQTVIQAKQICESLSL